MAYLTTYVFKIVFFDIFSTAPIILIMVQLFDDYYNNSCSAIMLFDYDTIFIVV